MLTVTKSRSSIDIAIIGAGPYGLSIAAHLRARGADFRIFGRPMQAWIDQMPNGMRLKSEGFASSLSDPDSDFTLADYCKEKGIPYADTALPVPIEVFFSYGLEFQKRLVPGVEDKVVTVLRRSAGGFELELGDGELVEARRVVVAVGIRHFRHVPDILAALPEELVSHSSDHGKLDRFKGKRVIVVGAGASALDDAALLHQAGASVELVARRKTIRFHDPPNTRPNTLRQRIRAPKTGLGPGWKSFWCVNAPLVFRQLPRKFRVATVRLVLSPAPGWFIKQDVVGKVPFNLECTIAQAKRENGQVTLEIANSDGTRKLLTADHIVAATGYKVDLRRIAFLGKEMLDGIESVEQSPVLSSSFESSIPGLYFVGASAANTFGPLLCFVFGRNFVARRLSKQLVKSAQRGVVASRTVAKAQVLDRG